MAMQMHDTEELELIQTLGKAGFVGFADEWRGQGQTLHQLEPETAAYVGCAAAGDAFARSFSLAALTNLRGTFNGSPEQLREVLEELVDMTLQAAREVTLSTLTSAIEELEVIRV